MPRPGNSQHSTTPKPTKARPFAVRFKDGGWQVKVAIWRRCTEVSLLAPTIALPNGELRGKGVVTEHGDVVAITA